MKFFIGLDDVYNAKHVPAACISVNRLRRRKSAFVVGEWIMDSGAFTTIVAHGGYPEEPEVYAAEILRWSGNGTLLAAVSQDYMCERFMLERTGLTVAQHQGLTVARYDRLLACDLGGVYLLPVLQGYAPADYVAHIRMYGDRLPVGLPERVHPVLGKLSPTGPWVGVGSVCKRNGDAAAIEDVLIAIKRERPDLRLHGFGVKITSLGSGLVQRLLYSADSMAWSFSARKQGRSAHDIGEALAFIERIRTMPVQERILYEGGSA